MRGLIISFALTSLLAFSAYGDGWQKHILLGGGLNEARDVAVSADGGYFVTGRSNAWAEGGYATNWFDHEAPLIKISHRGFEEWRVHLGQTGYFASGGSIYGYYDAGWSVEATPDSGCIVVGKTQSPNWTDPMLPGYPDCIGWDNMLIVRVNKWGDTLWTRSYGGFYYDRGWCIRSIPGSSDYIISGTTHTYGEGTPSEEESNIWLMRIDEDGEIVAHNAFGSAGEIDDSRWVTPTSDGGFCLVGYFNRIYADEGDLDYDVSTLVIIKTDSMCNEQWRKIYDPPGDDRPRCIIQTSDGGYVVAVLAKSFSEEYNRSKGWILRLDEDGDTLWTRVFGNDSLGNYTYGVVEADDGNLVICGSTGTFNLSEGRDAWLAKVDSDGNDIWNRVYDYGDVDRGDCLYSIRRDSDGYIAVGWSSAYGPSDRSDIIILKTDFDGIDNIDKQEIKPESLSISLFPNPFNSAVRIDAACGSTIEIYNLTGEKVAVIQANGNGQCLWQPDENVSSGVYLVKATIGKTEATGKAIYLK